MYYTAPLFCAVGEYTETNELSVQLTCNKPQGDLKHAAKPGTDGPYLTSSASITGRVSILVSVR